MNQQELRVHREAKNIGAVHRRVELRAVEILQTVQRIKLYKKFGGSLFKYAVEQMGFAEPTAYTMMAVARKALEIPELQNALRSKELTVYKASRLVSTLCARNASSLIEFAKKHTTRDVELELVRLNPKRKKRDTVRPISDSEVHLSGTISSDTAAKLKRAETLCAQKGLPTDLNSVLDKALDAWLDKNDPVRKAERAKPRNSVRRVVVKGIRTPLTAAQKHAVFKRDQGRCTHLHHGKRCNEERYIDIHHIVPVSAGGSNDPENLTTLCGFHHDLIHQLPLHPSFELNL